MKTRPGLLELALTALVLLLSDSKAQTNAATSLAWRDARELTIEGRGWNDTKQFYDRLPARAEGQVRAPVWGLGQHSAGICVRFVTDATEIAASWSLRKADLSMPHMPATGVSGVDLYVKEKDGWHWLANGRPLKQVEEKILIKGLAPGEREFLLYLPLYNGVTEVQIGVPTGARLRAASERKGGVKPIVFYGTSILQGGCASRPGMAYPSIIGRHLDWPTINLGFSGNAQSEPEVAALLAELDPALYVLDPLPNMSPEMVAQRIVPFVQTLRAAHPRTPILLVENATYPDAPFLASKREKVNASNARLREAYDRLRKQGVKKLYLFQSDKLLGTDGEATVDGTHPTDVGFIRMAEVLTPTIRRLVR